MFYDELATHAGTGRFRTGLMSLELVCQGWWHGYSLEGRQKKTQSIPSNTDHHLLWDQWSMIPYLAHSQHERPSFVNLIQAGITLEVSVGDCLPLVACLGVYFYCVGWLWEDLPLYRFNRQKIPDEYQVWCAEPNRLWEILLPQFLLLYLMVGIHPMKSPWPGNKPPCFSLS